MVWDKIKKMLGGEKKQYGTPYIVKANLHPIRIKSKSNDSVILEVYIKNVTNDDQLTSVKLVTTKWLGVDPTTLKKEQTLKLGNLSPGEDKTVEFKIHSNSGTPQGSHKLGLVVCSHFKDYEQSLNKVKKIIELRAA
ncbi:hypothetical protein KO465_09605 [Candidatus Micrarchaeota archaeon]|jgi:uncharacterized membrane protein|nr:hypothetical protein [Candidatus Micrarchaeota archaeon]